MRHVLLRLDNDLYSALTERAVHDNITVSEMMRRIFENAVVRMSAESGMDAVAALIRTEVGRAARSTESRITKILVKAAIAASTNAYLSLQCITAANKYDATEIHRTARRKAAEYLKVKEEE